MKVLNKLLGERDVTWCLGTSEHEDVEEEAGRARRKELRGRGQVTEAGTRNPGPQMPARDLALAEDTGEPWWEPSGGVSGWVGLP